jgi:hypothetical protein
VQYVRILILILFAVSLTGCDSGSDGPGPPAEISGIWAGVGSNPDVAKYKNCSGDMTPAEGMTLEDASAGGPTCTSTDPPLITQVDDVFTMTSRSYSCDDGTSYTAAGGGIVRGNKFTGSVEAVHSSGWVGEQSFKGTVIDSNELLLEYYNISYSGSVNGSCEINPRLEINITILPAPSNAAMQGYPTPSQMVVEYVRSIQP